MTKTRDLVEQVAQEIAASPRTSRTPPGRSDSTSGPDDAHIEAINQVFALFRLNYHNQYYAAYPSAEQLSQIKKLWLEALSDLPVEQILRGARRAIESCEYLPTLHRMLDCCQHGLEDQGLPPAREAYAQACRARSPKSAQKWSHPAVYLAGRDCGWHFLAGTREDIALPVFREHYERYCARVMRGEELDVPEPQALEKPTAQPLSREAQREELRKLREKTGL